MSTNPETRFKDKIRPKLNSIPKSHWYKIQSVAVRGIPDFIGLVNGRFVALELKTETGRVDPLQAYQLEKIATAGGYAVVVRPSNWAQVYEDLLEMSAN